MTYQDETGVVAVPPVEGRNTDLCVLVVMENLTAAVGVATENQAGLKPLQQLGGGREGIFSSYLYPRRLVRGVRVIIMAGFIHTVPAVTMNLSSPFKMPPAACDLYLALWLMANVTLYQGWPTNSTR